MKKFFIAILVATFIPAICFGQEDIDIEFAFDDFTDPTAVEVEFDQFTNDNIGFTVGEFEDLFGGDLETDNPGFITPSTEVDSGEIGRFNPGDEVSIRFLDASTNSATGEGFVTFFNPATGALEAGSSSITVTNLAGENGDPNGTTVLDGTTLTGPESLFLSEASDGSLFSNAADPAENVTLGLGEIHNHLGFDLDDSTQVAGAFGLLLQVEVDQFDSAIGSVDGDIDFTSDPFFIIFNNQLSDEVLLNQAVPAFVGVPEPTSGILLTAFAGAILTRRRRRI